MKRPAPATPASVQITSRSGGLSESMNQRAQSAPQRAMMSSGSTRFFFDFDIFSVAPMTAGVPGDLDGAARLALALDAHVSRQQPAAVLGAVGLVRDHALREQRRERLAQARVEVAGVGERA